MPASIHDSAEKTTDPASTAPVLSQLPPTPPHVAVPQRNTPTGEHPVLHATSTDDAPLHPVSVPENPAS